MTASAKACVLIIMTALACTGCGDSANFKAHEQYRKDRLAVLNDMVSILESIKDETAAAAAKPRLEALPAKMQELGDRRLKLTNLKPDESAALKTKLEKEETDHFNRLSTAMQNVHASNKILSEIHPLIDKINEADRGW